jgi:hypothetical protein
MKKTRRWVRFIKGYDLLKHEPLLELIKTGDDAGIVTYVERLLADAKRERRDFVQSHPRLVRLVKRDDAYWDQFYDSDLDLPESLDRFTEDERAEIDWFDDQLLALDYVVSLLQRALRDARSIAGPVPVDERSHVDR